MRSVPAAKDPTGALARRYGQYPSLPAPWSPRGDGDFTVDIGPYIIDICRDADGLGYSYEAKDALSRDTEAFFEWGIVSTLRQAAKEAIGHVRSQMKRDRAQFLAAAKAVAFVRDRSGGAR